MGEKEGRVLPLDFFFQTLRNGSSKSVKEDKIDF